MAQNGNKFFLLIDRQSDVVKKATDALDSLSLFQIKIDGLRFA
jgi:hypothetical protein